MKCQLCASTKLTQKASAFFDRPAWLKAKALACANFWHATDPAFKQDPWAKGAEGQVLLWKDDAGEFCASEPLPPAKLTQLMETGDLRLMKFLTHDLPCEVSNSPEI